VTYGDVVGGFGVGFALAGFVIWRTNRTHDQSSALDGLDLTGSPEVNGACAWCKSPVKGTALSQEMYKRFLAGVGLRPRVGHSCDSCGSLSCESCKAPAIALTSGYSKSRCQKCSAGASQIRVVLEV
jgi:hypothetical protein